MPMSFSQEENLKVIICSLHPHKPYLKDFRVRSFCMRQGWGHLKAMFRSADTRSKIDNKEA